MVIIGVDPHKSVHVASAVDPATNRRIDTIKAEASLAGYRRLLRWADKLGERRWAIENARGLGRHLAQWLVARDEVVDDVPSTATARVRELSRGGRRKNDVIDAAAAASVAALQGDANQVEPEDLTTVLALLDERRTNVIVQRTRSSPRNCWVAPPCIPVRHCRLVRQLLRSCTHRGGQRRPSPASASPRRRSAVEPRLAHHRVDPGPHASQHRPRLLRHQDRLREVTQRGDALPETAVGRPRVAADGSRRADPDSGPGRTFGRVSAVQRGWLNPDRQLFGQVTSRARRVQLYDPEISGLTNTEEPRVWWRLSFQEG
jgi:hypothetical protein